VGRRTFTLAMEGVTRRELRALVELLRDDDPAVRTQVTGHLLRLGDAALTVLDCAAATADLGHRARLSAVRDEVRRARTLDRLEAFAAMRGTARVEDGAALVAQLFHPGLDLARVRGKLDELARTFPEAAQAADPYASLDAVRRRLHIELGFRGNRADYYDPENSLIHRVLARRTGIPIALSVIYLALGRRLGQSVAGIGLPGHFIVRWGDAEPPLYADAFDGGAPLTELDCARLAQRHGPPLKAEHLLPVDAQEIAARIVRNLAGVWRQLGEGGLAALARAAHTRLRPEITLPE